MMNMRAAFKYLDTDNSRTLNRQEIERGLQIWNVPIDPWELDEMILACDPNGDGQVRRAGVPRYSPLHTRGLKRRVALRTATHRHPP